MSSQAVPVALAGFVAAFVEGVEALTVVLAVAVTRGWRGALAGSAAAVLLLAAVILLAGPALALLPLAPLRFIVGLLLLLFGLRWLRKAILRAAGVLPVNDEAAAYAAEVDRLGRGQRPGGLDATGLVNAFQITLIEGLEVVFIVVAMAAGRAELLAAAGLGAVVALLAVAALGVALHRPLARVPKNGLKFAVGTLLSAFGTFWVGEGTGLPWPGGDWSLAGLVAGFAAVALAAVPLCKARVRAPSLSSGDAR